MGDGHDGALVGGQVLLEPGHGLGVQVVGGLVQEEQVGGREQEAAQGHAATLTARELGDVGIAVRHAQGFHGDLDLVVEAPGVDGVDLVLDPGELVGNLVRVVGRELLEALQQVAGAGHAVFDVLADGLVGVEFGLLGQVADGGAVGEAGLALEVGVDPGHDAQEGGLTRAVHAEHADLGAGQEGQGDVLEHLAVVGGHHLGEAVHGVDVLVRSHEKPSLA
ncbi:hypothetical protein D3C86_999730 [compost metagenome]